MTWWQSLLIAIVPALITAGISLFVSIKQLKRTKKEIVEKYEAENNLYITKTRFSMEFDIYKELSEKYVRLVMHIINLFPLDGVAVQLYENYIDLACVYLDDAAATANKYAIFIPQNWYDRFTIIINLCRFQIEGYNKFYYGAMIGNNDFREQCYNRTKEIKEAFDSLVVELRAHINSLGINKEKTNAD